MDGTIPVANSHHVPTWLVRCCRWLTSGWGWLWSSFFNIFLNLIATWLFTSRDSNFNAFPLTTLLQYWYVPAISLVVSASFTWGAWAIGKLPMSESPRMLKRQYLTNWIYQTQDLAIEGIPLLPPRVRLAEIFITMQLRPHLSSIDQLLTREQSHLLREGMRHGKVAKEVERVLIDAERQYEFLLRKRDRIEIADLWRHLTREYPAAVIQGYPGMGKSTMLLRLTLYMAQHGRGWHDPLEKPLAPLMVPLFIRLGRYASYRKLAKSEINPSIWNYLASSPQEMADLMTPPMLAWLRGCVERGECLVLFDGLDEVSDPQERFEVQEALKAFIADANSKASGAKGYNRFLITSRVAGYDQNAFPGYPHYTIAELTPEQIQAFLPRWCRACVRGESTMRGATQEEIEQQVARQAALVENKLKNSIEGHQGIRELVENPFLLTLLAIMLQNGIDLPHRRVELYSVLTTILLETRNARRSLPIIPEAQAIQRLGPVAYQMQETKNSFATRNEVLTSFIHTIKHLEMVSPQQAQEVAEGFLYRVRERGGIFVLRTGDYFGFFHRTFQEYFAARHLLRLLATHTLTIDDLLDKVRQQDDLWREPFLLAVAYQTKDEAPLAWQMMRRLLSLSKGADQQRRFHDIVLVGKCLVEAKEATVPFELERDVALALLAMYEEALQAKDNGSCEQVEDILRRFLISVSSEAEQSPLLLTLQEILLTPEHPRHLQATLTLLTLIAHDLRTCADVVFAKLVPPLLGLTKMPQVGAFQPVEPATPPDFHTVDLAFSALSFMGIRGLAEVSLNHLRPRIEQHLHQLARNSLQSGFLITPAIVPFDQEHYSRYVNEVKRWEQLHEQVKKGKEVTEHHISRGVDIHHNLLATTQDVCYPVGMHLLGMLERSTSCTGCDWQPIWQGYLHEQMKTGTYLDYHISALLWVTLWPTPQGIQELASVLLEHFFEKTKSQRYAQRFFFSITHDLRDVSRLNNLIELTTEYSMNDVRYFRYAQYVKQMIALEKFNTLKYKEHLRYLNDLRQAKYSSNLSKIRHWSDLRYLSYISYWSYLRNLNTSQNWEHMSDLRYFRCLSYLRAFLFTAQIGIEVERRLQTCTETERPELLMLLLGRILHIREDEKRDQKTGQEIQHIVQVALPFAQTGTQEKEVLLDIVHSLPACTEQEIAFVLDLAKNVQDKDMQKACADAVRSCKPETPEVWTQLEQARTSSIPAIHEAIEWRLEQRKQDQ